MTRSYNTVDADGHILEPLTLWDDYIDPAFRDRRPQHVIDENGAERISVEGQLLGNPRGIGSLGFRSFRFRCCFICLDGLGLSGFRLSSVWIGLHSWWKSKEFSSEL